MRKPAVFLITGYARAGKDTLAEALALHLNCKVMAFATPLKESLNRYFTSLGIESVDLKRTEDKVRFRDLLVSAGKAARSVDHNVFADKVALDCHLEVMRGKCAVVSDWRYANEHARLLAKVGRGRLVTIHMDRHGGRPANEEEAATIDTILDTIPIDEGRAFASGDIAGIRDWAGEIANLHCPHVPAA